MPSTECRKHKKQQFGSLILLNSKTYFGEAWEDPFKVDFVSDAKCHERVFAAGVPRYRTICVRINDINLSSRKKTEHLKNNGKNSRRDNIFNRTHLKIVNGFWFEIDSVLHQSVCVDWNAPFYWQNLACKVKRTYRTISKS